LRKRATAIARASTRLIVIPLIAGLAVVYNRVTA